MPRTTIPGVKLKPGEVKRPSRRHLTAEERGLRYDMGQFYGMKTFLEQVFGPKVYQKLKETGRFKDWQSETSRLLAVIGLSIEATVKVADKEWRDEIGNVIKDGQHGIRETETMADLFAVLSTALARIAFLQIGMMPLRYRTAKPVRMKSEWWTLNRFRTVQYVQTSQQRDALDSALRERETKRKEAAERQREN